MKFSSELIRQAVDAFAGLPGIGKKTALRLVLHLLNNETTYTRTFADALTQMRTNVKACQRCYNISDHSICNICADPARSKHVICVVESIRDVMAIEDTQQFSGTYHVLGGVISPLEGIGPEKLEIDSLIQRVKEDDRVEEIIMAVSPTIEGETSIYYIAKRLAETNVKVSMLARGISFGGELEYADELTLGRSIIARVPYATNENG